MPQIDVKLLLNKTLYAKGPVSILDSGLNVVTTRKAGEVVGDVDSWITRNGVVYLTLKPYQTVRLVKVPNLNLSLSKIDSAEVFAQQSAAELQAMGPVAYYVKKYGTVLLAVLAGTYLLGTYIKKKL